MLEENGTKLKHYKGGRYTVIGLSTHSETLEEMLVYQNDVDKKIWVRPINMFYEEVEYKGKWVNRFDIIQRKTDFMRSEKMSFSEMSKEDAIKLLEEKIKGNEPSYSVIVNEAVRIIREERKNFNLLEQAVENNENAPSIFDDYHRLRENA